ncbi:retinol dehydrogenase 11-like [Halichondria panicea]|uniref:retinol dehydrogenase 11-like n=1 Tax=Halichondria panicea TaxID=6063 RepID=UPI00312B58BC
MWGSVAIVLVSAVVMLLVVKHRTSLKKHMCQSKAHLKGKTVLVTGANCGIGYETALELAKRQARVILACRNIENGEQAAVKIRQKSGNQDIIFLQLDLESMVSIRLFAEKILEFEPHIDVLLNNAGVMYPEYCATEDGFELHMGVNHLGHFLLTNLLLERLKESQPSRIVTVSSLLYKNCDQFDFDNMNSKSEARLSTQPNRHVAYCQSKLANILFTRELARRLSGTRVTANVLSPGMVQTRLGRHSLRKLPFALQPLVYVVLSLLFKTPWEGAQTSIHCALAEEMEEVSGAFVRDCQQAQLLTDVSKDEHVARKLWDVSCRLVGIV